MIEPAVLLRNIYRETPCSNHAHSFLSWQILYSGRESGLLRAEDDFVFCEGSLQESCPWLPALNLPDKQGKFNMEIAVKPNEVAVCSGQLIGHEWSADKNWKIFKYKVKIYSLHTFLPAEKPFLIGVCGCYPDLPLQLLLKT